MTEEVKVGGAWANSVHYLEVHDQILHIVKSKEVSDAVDFNFHETEHPFKHTLRIHYPKNHFRCAMVVNDRRKLANKDPNHLFFVLFSVEDRLHPCSLVKFRRQGNEWAENPEGLAVKYAGGVDEPS